MRRPLRTLALAAAGLLAAGAAARADFVVVANLTARPVTFEIAHPTAAGVPARKYTLQPMENRAVPAGREPEIALELAGRATRFRLDPYASYLFAEVEKKPIFQGIELVAALPAPADVPAKPPDRAAVAIPVKVYADQFESRNRATWEKALTRRVADLSEVLERQVGLTLEVVGADEWQAEPQDDLFGAMHEFERKAKAGPGGLALGFSGFRPPADAPKVAPGDTQLSAGRGPFGTHLVFRDAAVRGDGERQEVMLQEFGLWLGAAHTKDPYSAMRRRLADGAANRAGFFVQFDPVNLVVVNIWAKYRRAGKLRTWADISETDRQRLEVLYKTLAQICPEDQIVVEHLGVLERIRAKGVAAAAEGVDVPPKPREVHPAAPLAPPPDAKVAGAAKADGVRRVVAAVRERAKALHERPAADRLRGDPLTDDLVRAAATAALALDPAEQCPAFLTALGIALDDSTTLRANPLTRDLCVAAESDAERKERVAALGNPTVLSRRDLCQHFAISATLAELFGPAAAETAGVSKELLDMAGTSGFSFIDLTADLAGVAFAGRVRKDPKKLAELAEAFAVGDYVPATANLREGLSPKRFAADYGSVADARFAAALDGLRQRVAASPGLKPAK